MHVLLVSNVYCFDLTDNEHKMDEIKLPELCNDKIPLDQCIDKQKAQKQCTWICVLKHDNNLKGSGCLDQNFCNCMYDC